MSEWGKKSADIRRLAADGMSIAEIARQLDIKYQHAYSVLKNSTGTTKPDTLNSHKDMVCAERQEHSEVKNDIDRLLAIGFEVIGHWSLKESNLNFLLEKHADRRNALYAFANGTEILYIGKTRKSLNERMYQYKNPGPTQKTNITNHKNLLEFLKLDVDVSILGFLDSGLLHYGEFHLNLAAALEDGLIEKMQPLWNKSGK